jgi:hypothetical protein
MACEPRMIGLFSGQGCHIVALHFIVLNCLLFFHFFFLCLFPFVYHHGGNGSFASVGLRLAKYFESMWLPAQIKQQ